MSRQSQPDSAAAAKAATAKAPRARSRAARGLPSGPTPFWKQKTLEEFTREEWESLCDGCGRCCLVKLEDDDTGKVYFTDIGCKLLDAGSCRCSDYARRQRRVRDCIRLTPAKVRALGWLPPTCAYRLVAEGRNLFWWHPLISGSKESVHEAGVSVKGRVIASEKEVKPANYPRHIVAWPAKRPAACRKDPAVSGDASKKNP